MSTAAIVVWAAWVVFRATNTNECTGTSARVRAYEKFLADGGTRTADSDLYVSHNNTAHMGVLHTRGVWAAAL